MPISKCKSIEVIGNKIEDQELIMSKKITHCKGNIDKNNPICLICREEMTSTYGYYNGATESYYDKDGYINFRLYSYECKNYHNYSWSENI